MTRFAQLTPNALLGENEFLAYLADSRVEITYPEKGIFLCRTHTTRPESARKYGNMLSKEGLMIPNLAPEELDNLFTEVAFRLLDELDEHDYETCYARTKLADKRLTYVVVIRHVIKECLKLRGQILKIEERRLLIDRLKQKAKEEDIPFTVRALFGFQPHEELSCYPPEKGAQVFIKDSGLYLTRENLVSVEELMDSRIAYKRGEKKYYKDLKQRFVKSLNVSDGWLRARFDVRLKLIDQSGDGYSQAYRRERFGGSGFVYSDKRKVEISFPVAGSPALETGSSTRVGDSSCTLYDSDSQTTRMFIEAIEEVLESQREEVKFWFEDLDGKELAPQKVFELWSILKVFPKQYFPQIKEE